jgi:hypothetical protein
LDFDRDILVILGLKILSKKNHKHTSVCDGLDAIQVVLESPYNNQNPTFTTVLGTSHHHLFDNVIRAHKGGLVGLRWMFFFSSLFSLSFPRKSCLNFQKMNCVIWYVILSILVHFLLITVYLAFEPFWSLDFVQFHPLTFYSIWFFLFDLIPLLLILYFYVLYFFWLFFSCNFIPFHFITFLNSFLFSFFWFLYSYPFLDLSF